jgi:aspartate ammonia-lyase
MLENFLASNMMIDELKANQENHESYVEKIPVLDMLLNLYIGYLKAAEIYKESLKTNKSIKELVLSKVS